MRIALFVHLICTYPLMCKPCAGAKLVLRFQALIHVDSSSCISGLINSHVYTTNRHVHQDQYIENGFNFSQDLLIMYTEVQTEQIRKNNMEMIQIDSKYANVFQAN